MSEELLDHGRHPRPNLEIAATSPFDIDYDDGDKETHVSEELIRLHGASVAYVRGWDLHAGHERCDADVGDDRFATEEAAKVVTELED